MQTAQLALVVSVAGFALSLVNFGVSFAAFRRTHVGRLRVEARFDAKKSELRVKFVNTGSRPISIEEAQLGYGTAPAFIAPLIDLGEYLSNTTAFPIGELRVATIARDALVEKAKKIKQGRYRRLWVRVKLAGGGYVDEVVDIDMAMGPDDVPPQAALFMAADEVLGFPRLQPIVKIRPSTKS